MEEEFTTLQISVAYREKLRRLAQNNKRSMKNEFECIIDEEEIRRFGQQSTVATATPDNPQS